MKGEGCRRSSRQRQRRRHQQRCRPGSSVGHGGRVQGSGYQTRWQHVHGCQQLCTSDQGQAACVASGGFVRSPPPAVCAAWQSWAKRVVQLGSMGSNRDEGTQTNSVRFCTVGLSPVRMDSA